MSKLKENRWIRAAIPALLIHCSIGTVYCWSTFKENIALKIDMSPFSVGWAFSLAIFFLGMSAAFAGKFVEVDIHKSSLIACVCFTVGMIGTGVTINFLTGVPALILIYLFYGVIMGIGLGVGYLTPVKTLMLWFSDSKGLATGLSIMGFGLAKAIATPVMTLIQEKLNISAMFYILGGVYFVMMLLGHFMLKKPEGWTEQVGKTDFKASRMFKNKEFIGIWLMFFINIHCGLMIISYEKQILASLGMALTAFAVIPSVTAGFNAFGRIGYSTVSDKMKQRNTVYKIIFISCIAIVGISLKFYYTIPVIVLLCVVNAGYGGGFSTLPALLDERFGMKNVSKIHGLTLSAWGIAGLTGNNLSEIILSHTNQNYRYVITVPIILYAVALAISFFIVGNKKTNKEGN